MKKRNNPQDSDREELDVVKRYELSNHSEYFDVEELEIIIDHYLDEDDTFNASVALDLGFKTHPGNHELQLKQAQIYFSTGLYEKALQLLNQYPNQNDSEVLFWKGNILVQQQKIDEALVVFNQIVEQEKNDDYFDDLCFDIARTFKSEDVLHHSLRFLKLGYSFNPKNFDLLNQYALCCSMLAKNELAIKLLNEALDINPYFQPAWYQLAEIYFYMDNFAEAQNAVDYATLLDEKDIASWKLKGRIFCQLKDYEQAKRCFLHVLKFALSPTEQSEANILIGDCNEQLLNFETALFYYQEAVKSDLSMGIEDPEILIGCIYCMLELERYNEAETLSKKITAKYPHVAEGWVYFAEICVNKNKNAEAVAAYKKAIELDEVQPTVFVALGNVYFEMKDYKNALSMYQHAYRLDSNTENITLLLSIAYFKLDNHQKTFEFFDAANALYSNAKELFIDICPEAETAINAYLQQKK